MNNYTIAVDKIKDSISAQDVGEALGLEIRHGRCQCPIHGGNDFNCVLYKGNRGYYCHVCKSGGDVIKFVQEYHKTSFKDTISWYNDTFHLGLDLDSKIDPEESRRAEMAVKMRKEAIEAEAWKDKMKFDLFLVADEILCKLEEQRDKNVPQTPDEAWNEQFCQAIKTIPAAKRFVENCLMECCKHECAN